MSNNNQNMSFWQKFMKSMTKANDLEREDEVMLDHDYDGIKELDNVLPPWWLYGFYITIGISIFYYVAIYILGWYRQEDEYKEEVAQFEQYKAENPQFFTTDNLTAKMDAASLAKGKELFTAKTCVACHLVDGGGLIGPNLTDKNWILGGDFASVMNTIAKGGRPGKGMQSWEKQISLEDRQLLASYVLSLQGTTPATPKAAEGDLWENGVKVGGESTVAKVAKALDFNGEKLNVLEGGIEEQLINFMASDEYKKATPEVLKEKWFNFDNINFEMGSADKITAESQGQLENLAKILKANPTVKVKIGGYTDKKGDDAGNQKLSQKRADFIKAELTKLGVGAQVTGAEGYGEQYAKVDENATDAERAVDRKMALRLEK
jgi:cytochrome c oxidase cbb3-type subunit 3